MPDIHSYEPTAGHGLAHDPFNSIVGPRPIGWIATADAQGRHNLAPYSFFNAFNYVPPIIGFASVGWKDTVTNIQETGDFTWNLTTQHLAEAMNITSAPAARGQNEFLLAALTAAPSTLVKAPRVLESPVNFECRLTQLIQLTTQTGATVPTWLILGEVVMVHIDRALLKDGLYQSATSHPVLRWGGRGDYARIEPENVFELLRPTTA
jgi:flavin reductase (DIM6/NTAB) family NADH-FMN oxidoreductase RutF